MDMLIKLRENAFMMSLDIKLSPCPLSDSFVNSVQFSSVAQSCLTLCVLPSNSGRTLLWCDWISSYHHVHYLTVLSTQFSSVQSLSPVWIIADQTLLSITNSRNLPKLMSIESVMPSSHLILLPQSLSASGSFPMSQLFAWGGQSIGVSASASVLPMNIQDWFLFGWTSWISLQSKGLSRVLSNTTVQKHQFFGAQLSSQSNSHIHTWPLEKP